MKYEWNTYCSPLPPSKDNLEKLGEEGWEFVQLIWWEDKKCWVTYTKREVECSEFPNFM